MGTRGFITIATGNVLYYEIAVNLLHSYRLFTEKPLPFAILCDEENIYTDEFDDVILTKNAENSYNDKLLLGENLPYDENVFIEADCLTYSDLNRLFDVFSSSDDFSCFGKTLPIIGNGGGLVFI